jgi:hypothetical protein
MAETGGYNHRANGEGISLSVYRAEGVGPGSQLGKPRPCKCSRAPEHVHTSYIQVSMNVCTYDEQAQTSKSPRRLMEIARAR